VLEAGTWRGVHKTDTAVEGSTLKGSKAQESIGLGIAATRVLATDSDMEQGLEVEDWVERKKALVATRVLGDGSRAGSWKEIHFGGDLEGGRHQDDGEEATAAVTQCGCGRGKSSGGCEWRVEESREECRESQDDRREARKETARTPWPDAGCNKPAGFSEE